MRHCAPAPLPPVDVTSAEPESRRLAAQGPPAPAATRPQGGREVVAGERTHSPTPYAKAPALGASGHRLSLATRSAVDGRRPTPRKRRDGQAQRGRHARPGEDVAVARVE